MPSFLPHFAEPFKQNDASKFADFKDINITNLNRQFAKRIFLPIISFCEKIETCSLAFFSQFVDYTLED